MELLPLLRELMFHKHLLDMFRFKLANEPWVPQLTRHAQVFATPGERVRFAAFYSCRDAFRREVVLFATCNGDESAPELSVEF